MKLLELYKKKNRPLILDGAMGGFLQQKGFIKADGLWSAAANINSPESVLLLHKAYVGAGAEIITTNTFRTNPTYGGANYDVSQICKTPVSLAKQAIEGQEILIAGSNPPAEDCYQLKRTINNRRLADNHHKHIDALINEGVDLIWNETFSQMDEIEIVCDYCNKNNYEYTLNLFLTNELRILSGETLDYVLQHITEYKPAAVGFNCIYDQTFSMIKLRELRKNFGFYLNCGAGVITDKNIRTGVSPEKYANIILPYLEYNPLYIGTCCGSNPSHTKVIKETLVEIFDD